MIAILLMIHLVIIVALIGSILIQKSEGGALGIGGGGMSGFMTGRSTANLLTRTTAGLALAFFVLSIALAMLAGHNGAPRSVIDQDTIPLMPGAPTSAPEGSAPAAPTAPVAPAPPSAPLAK
jgi:preprotein translocase subunit SecG